MQNLFNNIYNLLQTPNKALDDIKNNISLSNAIIIISFISVFNYILHLNIYNPKSYVLIFFEIIFTIIGSIIFWIMFCAFFGIASKVFNNDSKFIELLSISAYSLIPLILISPLQLLKDVYVFGYILSVLLQLCVYLWVIYLFAKTLTIVYNLSFNKAYVLILLPLFCWFIGNIELINIITKIVYIFK
ncbi:MAG: hypothetical protein BHW64_03565 [Candidatus Melainabacteria bacterium LEY3_CP_29_8]|nr:MAG: hypothetical protein BHW64_03565 [Candidatus Melainabacteria bacterium LEY3_CP_29_8]